MKKDRERIKRTNRLELYRREETYSSYIWTNVSLKHVLYLISHVNDIIAQLSLSLVICISSEHCRSEHFLFLSMLKQRLAAVFFLAGPYTEHTTTTTLSTCSYLLALSSAI